MSQGFLRVWTSGHQEDLTSRQQDGNTSRHQDGKFLQIGCFENYHLELWN